MVSDSSESKESGNDSDTGIIDVDEVTIDTKTENGESDISENLTAPECITDDNSYDTTNDFLFSSPKPEDSYISV